MSKSFIKPEKDEDLNPVEYFNFHKTWQDVFDKVKDIDFINDKLISCDKTKEGTFEIKGDMLMALKENRLNIPVGKKYSKFMLLCRLHFKGNYHAAQIFISMKWLNAHVPYIRVGTDYFKIILKKDRYGVERRIIKGWKKEEIKQDHRGKIHTAGLFDDFCINPDNKEYRQVIDNCYNLYAPFSHQEVQKNIKESDVSTSLNLVKHIFGDQYEMGLIYLKVLYLHPRQALPILCLVSKARQTGKTTFLNWLQMIFGDNFVQINPEDLSSQFNSSYASKNLIAIEETLIEKAHAGEKLKSLATSKSISVNQKFVANYSLPFFGKLILCTNKEKDFMRVDEEEIRFWVRKIDTIKSINTKIEDQLKDEIPAFLRYLSQLPDVDFTRSRMVFTADELKNDQLESIKKESFSWLKKELYLFFEDFFNQNDGLNEVKASTSDIKTRWFDRNNQVNLSYILKVLKEEMGLKQGDLQRYTSFDNDPTSKIRGRPFTFKRSDYQHGILETEISDEIPF